MHVLTLKQPWAWAVFHAGKDVENRPAPATYRGLLYIHAGLKIDVGASGALRDLAALRGLELPPHFEHGVILGTVELIDCVTDSTSPWAIKGKSHWLITNPQLLPEPIPHRGLPWLHRKEKL